MNQAAQLSETLHASPGMPLIHVAGDLVIRFEASPLRNLAGLLTGRLAAAAFAESASATTDTSVDQETAAPLKIFADGSEAPATDPRTDHVAVLFPDTGWMVAVAALSNNGKPLKSQQAAEEAGKALQLLGHTDWMLAPDKVYERHVIDRRYHEPAADKNLFPNLPLSDWYWTSTAAPWSAESAFYVFLHLGAVGSGRRSSSGFGLACRRARQ